MPVLQETQIASLLAPYLNPVPHAVLSHLTIYLDLLVRWNTRTNLTAVRAPEEMVQRHFGESLFAAQHLGDLPPETVLDLGSGAGFPGVPIALMYPSIPVTLAESQNKKATFLREIVRTLGLRNVEVWAGRAEALPLDRMFHTVALRAVDNMEGALAAAALRASRQIVLLATVTPVIPTEFVISDITPLPCSENGLVLRAVRR